MEPTAVQSKVEKILEIRLTLLIHFKKSSQLILEIQALQEKFNLSSYSHKQIVDIDDLVADFIDFLTPFTNMENILQTWRVNSHRERFSFFKQRFKLLKHMNVDQLHETEANDEILWNEAITIDFEMLKQSLLPLLLEQNIAESDVFAMFNELEVFELREIAVWEANPQVEMGIYENHENDSVKIINSSAVTYNENQPLGEGGFGTVYKCRYNNGNYAIKIVKPFHTTVADLKHEAMTMQLVSHPNIISYYGARLEEPKRFIVLELAVCSLFDVLHTPEKPQFYSLFGADLTLQMKTAMLCDCLKALAYLHSNRIIHRDITARNILVSTNRILKITDFGLAKIKHITSATRSSTGLKGTAVYMAPEVLTSDEPEDSVYSKASDVYAFSILMNEVLSRKKPFDGLGYPRVVCKISAGHHPDLFGISLNENECKEYGIVMEYQQLINKCWDVDVSKRLTFNKLLRYVDFILSALGGDPRGTALLPALPEVPAQLVSMAQDAPPQLQPLHPPPTVQPQYIDDNFDTTMIPEYEPLSLELALQQPSPQLLAPPVYDRNNEAVHFTIVPEFVQPLHVDYTQKFEQLIYIEIALDLWMEIYNHTELKVLLENETLVAAMASSILRLFDGCPYENEVIKGDLSLICEQNNEFFSFLVDSAEKSLTFSDITCSKYIKCMAYMCSSEYRQYDHEKNIAEKLIKLGALNTIMTAINVFPNHPDIIRYGMNFIANSCDNLMCENVLDLLKLNDNLPPIIINRIQTHSVYISSTMVRKRPTVTISDKNLSVAQNCFKALSKLCNNSNIAELFCCVESFKLVEIMWTCYSTDVKLLRRGLLFIAFLTKHSQFIDNIVSRMSLSKLCALLLNIISPKLIVKQPDGKLMENCLFCVNHLSALPELVTRFHKDKVYDALAIGWKNKYWYQKSKMNLNSLLHAAIEIDCESLFTVLLKDYTSLYGETHVEAALYGRNKDGHTLFMHAIIQQRVNMLTALQSIGYNFDKGPQSGITPVKLAFATNNIEIIKFGMKALNWGGYVNDNGDTRLNWAVKNGDVILIKSLHGHGGVPRWEANIPDVDGNGPWDNSNGNDLKEKIPFYTNPQYIGLGGMLVISAQRTNNAHINFFRLNPLRDHKWQISVFYLSDQLGTTPSKVFALLEKCTADIQPFEFHKFSMPFRNVVHDTYNVEVMEIDKQFRDTIFGPLKYTDYLKPRFYVETGVVKLQEGDIPMILEDRLKTVSLYSDFIEIIRAFGDLSKMTDAHWSSLTRSPENMLTPYDVLLFESKEVRGRNRRNSLDVEERFDRDLSISYHNRTSQQQELYDEITRNSFFEAFIRNDQHLMSLMLYFGCVNCLGHRDLYNKHGFNVLMYACTMKDCKLFKVIMNAAAEQNSFEHTCCWALYQSKNEKTERQTPLHIAALYGNEEAVLLLTKHPNMRVEYFHGPYIEPVDQKGNTVLHCAVLGGNFKIAKLIFDWCTVAVRNQTDNFGYTAVSLAASRGHYMMVKYFLENNVDFTKVDSMGRSPISFVEATSASDRNRNIMIYELFRKKSRELNTWTPEQEIFGADYMMPSFSTESTAMQRLRSMNFANETIIAKFTDIIQQAEQQFDALESDDFLENVAPIVYHRVFAGESLEDMKTTAVIYGEVLKDMGILSIGSVGMLNYDTLLTLDVVCEKLGKCEGKVMIINIRSVDMFDSNALQLLCDELQHLHDIVVVLCIQPGNLDTFQAAIPDTVTSVFSQDGTLFFGFA